MAELDDLMKEWSEDSKVDETKLSEEILKTANLHSKYINIMTNHRLKSRSLAVKYDREKIFKIEYYMGKHNTDEKLLESRGLEPMRDRITKSGIQNYLDADQELIDIMLKKVIEDEIVSYCEEVIKALQNRSYAISAAIKWNIFTGGG